jgi:hypothetical protein
MNLSPTRRSAASASPNFFKKSKFDFLPKFVSYTRQSMLVCLEMTHYPLSLREIIGRRIAMQTQGHSIILHLLRVLRKLRIAEVAVRGINPSTISFSNNLDYIMVVDITTTCWTTSEPKYRYIRYPPYSARLMPEFADIDSESPLWDQWSVGVVILEILVGTDLVLAANSYPKMIKLYEDCLEFIEDSYGCMLEKLLSTEEIADVDKLIQTFEAN